MGLARQWALSLALLSWGSATSGTRRQTCDELLAGYWEGSDRTPLSGDLPPHLRRKADALHDHWRRQLADDIVQLREESLVLCPQKADASDGLDVWCWSVEVGVDGRRYDAKGTACNPLIVALNATQDDADSPLAVIVSALSMGQELGSDRCDAAEGVRVYQSELRRPVSVAGWSDSSVQLTKVVADWFLVSCRSSHFSFSCAKDRCAVELYGDLTAVARAWHRSPVLLGLIGVTAAATLLSFLAWIAVLCNRLAFGWVKALCQDIGHLEVVLTKGREFRLLPSFLELWAFTLEEQMPGLYSFIHAETEAAMKHLRLFPILTETDSHYFNFWGWKTKTSQINPEMRHRHVDLMIWVPYEVLAKGGLLQGGAGVREARNPLYATYYGLRNSSIFETSRDRRASGSAGTYYETSSPMLHARHLRDADASTAVLPSPATQPTSALSSDSTDPTATSNTTTSFT